MATPDTSFDSPAARPSPEEIIGAIRDAGWLLEQDTESALSRAGFHTVMGHAFPDPDDSSISREVDVTGYRELHQDRELAVSVGIRVIAECKQSVMPYVLIGRLQDASAFDGPMLEQTFRFPQVETGRTPLEKDRYRIHNTDARDYLGIRSLKGNPWNARFVATQMTRLDRKKTWLADNRGIFTSLVYPLAKALLYFRSRQNTGSNVDHKPGRDWASIEFVYPNVVASAPVYVVDVSEDEMQPTEVAWASMTRQIKAKNVSGQFYVDVVNDKQLDAYIAERVSRFGDQVALLVRDDPQRFVTNVDHSYEP